jgi:hypothetical protein
LNGAAANQKSQAKRSDKALHLREIYANPYSNTVNKPLRVEPHPERRVWTPPGPLG